MPSIKLTLTGSPQKNCFVRQVGVSEVRLTALEYAALALPGAGPPPGVLKADWESQRVFAYGMDHSEGDIILAPDGTAVVLVQERAGATAFDRLWLRLPPAVFSGVVPDITIPALNLAPLNTAKLAPTTTAPNPWVGSLASTVVALVSLDTGVLTWQ